MTREPYASADGCSGSSTTAPPTAAGPPPPGWPTRSRTRVMVHPPVHASWLNQIEIYFSIVQRKVLTPDDFTDLDDLAERITAFEDRYNDAAHPFDWRFSRDDLDRLIDRIAA